ncbi:hypothetical protein THASP1DRAFT_32694 [Thamnocephalis sphaerospora]|uniref:Uncharacterized protein n=1 Tax=Thamnocephalis sphaerospora TaxID=78915 RepID=A0A4P9XI06_9FUNG|nr:hypothetical protein THASP1DRAFT_32897 [Thamnocephalis sphaerospora]RKP05467.1 hypothetical protein THASP1DRAFT_32694 [Thamnocephalis sphaerospora]|eukprot:RKP05266.1 hypothetical protein THASP1DRAFT_32897 [Thamnocephalis sphaerospora]
MEIPLPSEGTFDVVLGDSFATPDAENERELVILKYNRQAVETAQEGAVAWDDRSGEAQLTWTAAEGTRQCTGKRADARSVECLLSFTLERPARMYQFQSAYGAASGAGASARASAASTAPSLVLPGMAKARASGASRKAGAGTAAAQPLSPTEAELDEAFEIDDDFIEVDPVVPSSHGFAKGTARQTHQTSIYAPVTVSGLGVAGANADNDGYSSSTSSGSSGSSSSGSSSSGSGSSRSGSSSDSDSGSDSGSSSDSDLDNEGGKKRTKGAKAARGAAASIPAPAEPASDEMHIDGLEEEIAAALENGDDKDAGDSLEWLEDELEAALA